MKRNLLNTNLVQCLLKVFCSKLRDYYMILWQFGQKLVKEDSFLFFYRKYLGLIKKNTEVTMLSHIYPIDSYDYQHYSLFSSLVKMFGIWMCCKSSKNVLSCSVRFVGPRKSLTVLRKSFKCVWKCCCRMLAIYSRIATSFNLDLSKSFNP